VQPPDDPALLDDIDGLLVEVGSSFGAAAAAPGQLLSSWHGCCCCQLNG
jgi:hypothetical protein